MTYDDGIPDCIRRDKDNRAPFMLHPDVTSPMTVGPEAFWVDGLCEDEGCPQHGTPKASPAASLPASFPWELPPSCSKTDFPGA